MLKVPYCDSSCKILAQERMPRRKLSISYFSFGLWDAVVIEGKARENDVHAELLLQLPRSREWNRRR